MKIIQKIFLSNRLLLICSPRSNRGHLSTPIKSGSILTSQFSSLTSCRGSALLSLLFFMIITITITTASIVVLLTNSISGAKLQQGSIAYQIAQSGVENAKLRLLRDPGYTGETLQVGNGTALIQVTNIGTNYTILSTGQIGNFVRKIEVTASFSNNIFTFTSQREIF